MDIIIKEEVSIHIKRPMEVIALVTVRGTLDRK